MTREQQKVKVARKTFQSSLKASRIHYRREKKGLKPHFLNDALSCAELRKLKQGNNVRL